MAHRLRLIMLSLFGMALLIVFILLAKGWPGKTLSQAWVDGQWTIFQISLLLGITLCIIGMVKTTSRRMPPGSIGTEAPEERPEGYRSPQYDGGSYLIAGALLLLVGTSICWGGMAL